MAIRTTAQDVLDIMGADTTLTATTILPYIESANVFVTEILEDEHEAATLTEIEKWISAHMAIVTKERLSKEAGAGDAYIKYAGMWGEELSSTQYGQMALMLDTSNVLRNLKKGKMQAWIYAVPGV